MTLILSFVGSIDWISVARFFSAATAPVVAVVVTYIAIAQFLLNRRQYRLALFEKRMAVFSSTMNMIASVVQSANPSLDECMKFIRDTRDHELLFGPEVGAFIDKVFGKAVLLEAHVTQTGAHKKEIMDWFFKQSGEARKIFLKYLDFRKP
jgi:hypothetical protein